MNHIFRALLVLGVGTACAFVFNAKRTEILGRVAASAADFASFLERKGEPLEWIYEPEGTLDDVKVLEEHSVTLEEVVELYDQGMPFLVDARKPDAYSQGHIQGALNVPFNAPEEKLAEVFANCIPDAPVIVYCEGAECESSKVVCQFLEESGYSNVKIFLPGYDTLVEGGLDVIEGPGPYGDEGDPNSMNLDPNDPNANPSGFDPNTMNDPNSEEGRD